MRNSIETFDTLEDFWAKYFSAINTGGNFDKWVIAKFIHTTEADYELLRRQGADKLGFKPTMAVLADPLEQKFQEVMIKNLSDQQFMSFASGYRQRFNSQYKLRNGLFYPDKKQADAIFGSWEELESEWLSRNGKSMLSYNLPLLIDHVSDQQYWSWGQKNFDPCGTQRLVLTIFQYRTGRFADVFITNVDDAEFSRICLLLESRVGIELENIL